MVQIHKVIITILQVERIPQGAHPIIIQTIMVRIIIQMIMEVHTTTMATVVQPTLPPLVSRHQKADKFVSTMFGVRTNQSQRNNTVAYQVLFNVD